LRLNNLILKNKKNKKRIKKILKKKSELT
jgi:hypothetical protein